MPWLLAYSVTSHGIGFLKAGAHTDAGGVLFSSSLFVFVFVLMSLHCVLPLQGALHGVTGALHGVTGALHGVTSD
jgi:hypothetical protein